MRQINQFKADGGGVGFVFARSGSPGNAGGGGGRNPLKSRRAGGMDGGLHPIMSHGDLIRTLGLATKASKREAPYHGRKETSGSFWADCTT